MNNPTYLKFSRSLFFFVGVCLVPTAQAATIEADFTAGNTNASVDGYTGMAGDGWLGAWTELKQNTSTTFSNSVEDTDPLSGGGNYLSATMSYSQSTGTGQGVVYRQFDTSVVDTSEATRYRFDLRIDTALSNTTQRYNIFNRVGSPGTGTDSSATWVIQALYNGSSATWQILNGNGEGGAIGWVNTGVAANAGTTYTFTVDTDPQNKSWTLMIDDGSSTYESGSVGFRVNSTTDGNTLHFGALATANSSLGYSLDNITISQIPEPATSAAAAGILALIICLYRRRHAKP